MPWKNGGGSTLELYRHEDGGEGFGWRVSIATVAANGPFSRFPGYDRHIMALDGDGFDLSGGPDGPIAVAPLLTPQSFSGDWDVTATLRGRPSRDFNLIARQRQYDSSMQVVTLNAETTLSFHAAEHFIHVLSGTLQCGASQSTAGDSICVSAGVEITMCCAQPSRIAVCRVFTRP